MTSDITAKGSCLCKSVTYDIIGQPIQRVVCHCLNCQKTSGSSMSANLLFMDPQVVISDPESVLKWYDDKGDSGGTNRRSFCSKCGSSLIVKPVMKEGSAALAIVCSGTVDGISEIAGWNPAVEVYAAAKRKWLPEFKEVKSFEKMFPI